MKKFIPLLLLFFLWQEESFAQLTGFTLIGNPQSTTGATWTYQDTVNGTWYDLQGILFEPSTGSATYPAVIISHGGGGNSNGYSKNIAKEMVTWGLVCIGTNLCHSGSAPIGSPGDTSSTHRGASIANTQRNMKCWDILASLGYVDTNCVAAHGFSLGAMATGATVGMNPTKFSVASHCAGGVNDAGPQYIKTPQANGIAVPYYMHHGDADAIVTLTSAKKMDTILTNNGVAHQLEVYPGFNHNMISLDDTMFAHTKNWYAQYLCTSNPSSVNEISNSESEITLSPNPTENILNIKFTSQYFNVAVFDLIGKNVYSQSNIFDQMQVSFKNFKHGIYFVQVSNSKHRLTKKIIINQ